MLSFSNLATHQLRCVPNWVRVLGPHKAQKLTLEPPLALVHIAPRSRNLGINSNFKRILRKRQFITFMSSHTSIMMCPELGKSSGAS